MKCIFAATPYLFAIHYHAFAIVASRVQTGWTVSLDGLPEVYRMQCGRDAAGRLNLECAVFVPCTMDADAVWRLLKSFSVVHPGVLPANLTFEPAQQDWSVRARHRLQTLAPRDDARKHVTVGKSPAVAPQTLLRFRRVRRLMESHVRPHLADMLMPVA